MRDSSSRTGYIVLYGLGRRKAKIEVGEFEGSVEVCAEASPAQSVSTINHIIPEIAGLSGRTFPLVDFILAEGVPVTDDWGAIAFLFEGCSPSVGHWLDFVLTLS